jgi:hypothetical protein
MINNSTNINSTKESLTSDGQQFHQYQQNKRKLKTVMINNTTVVDIGGIVDHHCLNFLLHC